MHAATHASHAGTMHNYLGTGIKLLSVEIICTGTQYAGTAIWYQLLNLPVPSVLNLVQTRVLPWILPLNLTDGFSSKIFDPRYFTESVSHSCWSMPRAIYAASQFASQIGGADGAARHH